jgi:type VI secretion system protein ImpA
MPLRDDLLAPISGSNPSGKNLKYDRVFDEIKEARREDIDVNQGDWKVPLKTADWAKVVKVAGEVLAKRSKDLQIAAWLIDAHVRREGFGVLAPSFVLLQSLLDEFWDTLYPELEDGDSELRSTPLEWLGNKLPDAIVLVPITSAGLSWSSFQQSRIAGYEQDANTEAKKKVRQQAINDGKPTAEDFDEAVNATSREFYDAMEASLGPALEELEKLNTLCDDKFGTFAPSMVKIRTLLENILQQTRNILKKKPAPPAAVTAVLVEVTTPAPAAEPVSAAPAPVVAAAVTVVQAPAQPAAPAVAASVSGDPTGLDDCIKRIGALCRWLRDKTIYDASAFLMIRAMRWGELRAKAPEILPAMLEAPTTEVRAGIKQAFVAGSWDTVLNATESAMELPCGRAWLDLQRYAVLALEAKGAYYAGVGLAIRKALRDLIEEFPALLEQTLNDDTPVANPETRAWIHEFVLSGAPLAAPVMLAAPALPVQEAVTVTAPPRQIALQKPPELEPEEQFPGDVFDQALAAARANRSAEALDLIYKQLAAERSGRGRFRRRTQLAHLLMASGHEKIASPILRELAGEIEQRRLDDWERGEALAYPVELLIRCLDSNGADAADRKQLYDRLCRLDPVRALQWSAP